MKPSLPRLGLAFLAASSTLLAGCLNLKPVVDPTRYFVLATLPPDPAAQKLPPRPLALGISPVGIPEYLNSRRLVMRKGDHEILYTDYLRWGEPLDQGCQRVLAANLAQLLGTKDIYLSQWRRDAVACELHVQVARFDVSDQGQVVLEAFWHVTLPGAGQRLHTGTTRLDKTGPPPAANPDAAVAVMSDVLGDLSRAAATALQTLTIPSP